jgi:3-hydroxyacyl-[acyl-carrier-protein] dehydratase
MSPEFEAVKSGYRWFDRILDITSGRKATAVKDVDPAEIFFTDHFPRLPIVPGMLQLEGLIQLGGWLIDFSHDFKSAAVPRGIKGVDFRRYVNPGARLVFETEIRSLGADDAVIKARATMDGKPVANAREIEYSYLPLSPAQVTGQRERFLDLSRLS